MQDLLEQYLTQPQGGQFMSPQVLAMQRMLGQFGAGQQPPMPGQDQERAAYLQMLERAALEANLSGAGTMAQMAGATADMPAIQAAAQFLQQAPPEPHNQMFMLEEMAGQSPMGGKGMGGK